MRRSAFTLIELLVVIAIIVALIAILIPSLNRAVEAARRAACASNQHQIQLGAVAYAASNRGTLFKCRLSAGQVQIAFDPIAQGVDALASVGLAEPTKQNVGGGYTSHQPAEVWNCPSREYESQWEANFPALIVGYQYMGGITTWSNPFVGSMPARSPVTLASGKPGWVLVADTSGKIDNAWGGGRDTAFEDTPSHPTRAGAWPEGHNQAEMSGAVRWVDGDDLVFIHSWGGMNRVYFMAQDDLGGWTPPVGAYLDAFK